MRERGGGRPEGEISLNSTYYSLLIVTLVAFMSPWLSFKLTRGFIPAIVIEILLGIVAGPSLSHLAFSTQYIRFLSNLGFSYLMFLSGLEIDFDVIMQKPAGSGSPAWVRGIWFFLTALAISLLIAYAMELMGMHFRQPIFLALILSTTSIGIVTPALKEKSWLLVPFGQEILLYALLADIVTLLLVAAYTTLHTTGNAASVLLVMFLLLLFVVAYIILKAVRGVKFFRVVENATSELGLRGAFALILIFLALAEALGTQVVVGAFLAGAIISLLSERHSELTQKLNSIGYGFFLPIFFVNVGLTFNLRSLVAGPAFWISMLVILVAMYANKLIGTLIWMRSFSIRRRLGAGVLLGSQLSLTIVASQIGQQIGVLSTRTANGIVLLAIVTCLISPGVFTRLVGRQKEVAAPEGTGKLPADFLPDGWVVSEIEVLSPRFSHTPMRRLLLPQEVLFITVERGAEKIIPRGHTVLEQFDVIHVMGTPKAVDRLRRRFGQ